MVKKLWWGVFLLILVSAASCTRASDKPPPDVPKPVPTPESAYVGFLEAAHDTAVSGWVWDKNRPDAVLSVDILDGTTLLTTVKADVFRKDLLEGNVGTGKYGFKAPMPASLKDGQPHEIHAVVSGTKFELKNSPKTYQFQPKKKATP